MQNMSNMEYGIKDIINNNDEFRDEQITPEKALEIIKGLPPEIKAVADEWLVFPPNIALKIARAQEIIKGLPPEIKAVADEYLAKRLHPEQALEMAIAQGTINELSPKLKAVADECLAKRYSPIEALIIAYKKSQEIDAHKVEELRKRL